MNDSTFESLFKAKLHDNGVEYSEDDYKRFYRQVSQSFSKGVLDLSGQRIGINVLTKLTKVLRTASHIRVFNFYGNLIRDHGIHSLSQLLFANSQVQILDIGCNDFSNQAVPSITDIIKNTGVISLQLGTTGVAWHNNKFSITSIIDIINAIKSANRIQCLGLSGLQMILRTGSHTTSCAPEIADFIRENKSLTTFALAGCGFNLRDEEIIVQQGLLENNRLRYLDIHSSALGDPAGPRFLGNINQMENLYYLDIHKCDLSSESGKALAYSLSQQNHITILNLSQNPIGDEGFRDIFSVLLENDTLTELNIAECGITSELAPLIGQVIQKNQILNSLDLSTNSLGDEGAEEIASTIGENTSLTKLSLSSIRMNDTGAIAIAKALPKNSTLRILKISDNFLTRESGYKILDEIRANEHLFVVDVSATQIDHFVIKAMNDLCKRNKQIQKEIDLQPLKKQLVQLSIQRTKMPEAESRLANLEAMREKLENDVNETEDKIESTQAHAEIDILTLNKTIIATKESIKAEEEAIEKLTAEREKMINEFEENLTEIKANSEKEKIMTEKLEQEAETIEQLRIKEENARNAQIEELQHQLADIEEIIQKQQEIGEDQELLKDYVEPELPEFAKETEHVFIADEITEIRENEKKLKKKKKGKKSSKSSIKTSRSVVTQRSNAEELSESQNEISVSSKSLRDVGENSQKSINLSSNITSNKDLNKENEIHDSLTDTKNVYRTLEIAPVSERSNKTKKALPKILKVKTKNNNRPTSSRRIAPPNRPISPI